MKKIFFFLTFVLYSLFAIADPDINADDFIPEGMDHENVYDLGYSSRKIESSFAIIVYNPNKDERGIVIVNKTRKGKYKKIAENLNCLLGDSASGAAGIDEYKANGLNIEAEEGTLSISYSHSQCADTCRWVILDNSVRSSSFSGYCASSMTAYTYIIDLNKMKKYTNFIEREWVSDEYEYSVVVDNIRDEEYDIFFDKGYKRPTFKDMNFISGNFGLHIHEKFIKSETRQEY